MHRSERDKKPNRRGPGGKAPVFALVERDGRAVAEPMGTVNAQNIRQLKLEQVDRKATTMTDEAIVYRGLDRVFARHDSVNHAVGQYVDGDAHTANIDSFFALLKRGIVGAFHHVSHKHLHRYCDEFAFRWNHRKVTDGERTLAALRGTSGKRLAYRAIKGQGVV